VQLDLFALLVDQREVAPNDVGPVLVGLYERSDLDHLWVLE
jgi:hypothetical protein